MTEEELEKLKSEGRLYGTVPEHEETPEEKVFKEYLKSVEVKSVSLISEKTMRPRLLISFEDNTQEEYDFTNEEIQKMRNTKDIDMKQLMTKSERLKNKDRFDKLNEILNEE